MKASKIFWIVVIALLLNVLILIIYQTNKVNKAISKDGITQSIGSLADAIWIEGAIVLFLGAIPGLNLIALVLVLPILLFNIVTKLVPLLQIFNSSNGSNVSIPTTSDGFFGTLKTPWSK